MIERAVRLPLLLVRSLTTRARRLRGCLRLDHGARQFLDEQWHAVGTLDNLRRQRLGQRALAGGGRGAGGIARLVDGAA